jgi:hypothetical protein
MTNHAKDLSASDLAALAAVASCNIETNKAVQELARAIARSHGVELSRQADRSQPEPNKPRRRGRHRYTSITRHGLGNVTAGVVNMDTGRERRFRILRTDDGGLDVEEL